MISEVKGDATVCQSERGTRIGEIHHFMTSERCGDNGQRNKLARSLICIVVSLLCTGLLQLLTRAENKRQESKAFSGHEYLCCQKVV